MSGENRSPARSLPEIQTIVRIGARRLTGADGATFVLRDGDKCFYADEDATWSTRSCASPDRGDGLVEVVVGVVVVRGEADTGFAE
ncbi:hypothetical protein OJ998_23900 [Solirubrobacter taibaiensis]|nr:hypothetical protein [Solirubrobacter taibaiensis]